MRISDWSSDVCSSDLLIDLPLRVDAAAAAHVDERLHEAGLLAPGQAQWDVRLRDAFDPSEMAARFADVAANIMLPTLYVRGAMSELVSPDDAAARSEARRVGKECVSTCRSRWSQYH